VYRLATTEEVKRELEKWAKKVEDPEIAEEFEGYNKTLQLSFPDLDYHLQLIIENQKARIEEGLDENAAMSLDVESDMFIGICTGEIDPMEAFMDGQLKPKGNMADLEVLEVFMDDI